ncbi:MAG: pantoate--beta-alanine ligase [Opitutales bacterium]
MRVIRLLDEMQRVAGSLRTEGKSIGLVPTMGCLHEGHLSVVDLARDCCDAVIVTIFVNPTQFGEGEDFEQYPRDLDRDLALCENRQVDMVFVPAGSDLFPEDHSTFVEETQLAQGLCGESRHTHFRGVVTVCLKLFVLCQPNFSFFGQKDAQQVAIIRRMVRDFHLPVEIEVGPTVREHDGLAMSSRNLNLDSDQRRDALLLIEALRAGKALTDGGTLQVDRVRTEIKEVLSRGPRLRVIYVEVVDAETMEPIAREIQLGRDLLVVAAWVDSVRLIDNLQL